MEYNLKDRPTGITILAWLHIIGGLFTILLLIVTPFIASVEVDIFKISFNSKDIPRAVSVSLFALFGVVNIFAGLEMLQGKKWGWWFGLFYHVFTLTNSFIAYIILPVLIILGIVTRTETNHSHWGSIDLVVLFTIFIVWYFLSQRVFDYFEFAITSRLNRFWTIFGISILIVLLFAGIDFLLPEEIG